MKPSFVESFQHDGRGPELQRMVWSRNGSVLRAIEYFNPDDACEAKNLKHVKLTGVQVVMITPEEGIGMSQLGADFSKYRPASIFDLGRSRWFRSFAPLHLGACRHYQMLFYDHLVDVICEKLECLVGPYSDAGAAVSYRGAEFELRRAEFGADLVTDSPEVD